MAGPSSRVTCNKAIGNKNASPLSKKSPSLVVKLPVRAKLQLKAPPEEITRGDVPQEKLQKIW